jgi:hypothetical protein
MWYHHSSWVVTFFDKTRFRLFPGHLPISLWEIETGGRGDVLPFHLIAQRSFVGVDSFDKTRFRFIAGHLPISLPETETGRDG